MYFWSYVEMNQDWLSKDKPWSSLKITLNRLIRDSSAIVEN